jgi:excisionase family DNA binding protein
MNTTEHERRPGPGAPSTKLERPTASVPRSRLLTVAQTAEVLGMRAATVYGWIAARRIPFVLHGRAVRIPADALQRLIEENTVPPIGRSAR